MSFLLDLLCVLLIGLLIFAVARRPLSSALFTLGCFLVALSAAYFSSAPVSLPVSSQWIAPLLEKQAANDLADLFSAPHLETGKETVRQLDFTQMLEERPEAFLKRIEKYGGNIDQAQAAFEEKGGVGLLEAITREGAKALARGVTFLGLYLVLFSILRFITKRIENNLPPPPKQRASRRFGSVAAAVVSALSVIMALGVLLEITVPYLERWFLFFSVRSLQETVVYKYINLINPFVLLYSA